MFSGPRGRCDMDWPNARRGMSAARPKNEPVRPPCLASGGDLRHRGAAPRRGSAIIPAAVVAVVRGRRSSVVVSAATAAAAIPAHVPSSVEFGGAPRGSAIVRVAIVPAVVAAATGSVPRSDSPPPCGVARSPTIVARPAAERAIVVSGRMRGLGGFHARSVELAGG